MKQNRHLASIQMSPCWLHLVWDSGTLVTAKAVHQSKICRIMSHTSQDLAPRQSWRFWG